MRRKSMLHRNLVVTVIAFMSVFVWPASALTQTVLGQARAVKVALPGHVTILADSGSLAGESDAREAHHGGHIVSLGGLDALHGDVLHATTISSIDGWDLQDFIASEASLANLAVSVAGNTISAAFIMAKAVAPVGAPSVATAIIDGLVVNGVPIAVTGDVTEQIPLAGGHVIINELQNATDRAAITALHLVIDGVADITIGSATAGILAAPSSLPATVDALDLVTSSTTSTLDSTTSSSTSTLDSTTSSTTSTLDSTTSSTTSTIDSTTSSPASTLDSTTSSTTSTVDSTTSSTTSTIDSTIDSTTSSTTLP